MAKTDLEHAAEFARDTLARERNGWAPPHQAVKDLAEEFLKLVEAQRWRDWPEEVPEKDGRVQVYFFTTPWGELVHELCNYRDGEFWGQAYGAKKLKWRPIGELPEPTP